MIDEELVRLIREVVRQEMKTARSSLSEIGGAGGTTVISSRGDIVLAPGVGRHAYYQKDSGRTEIGAGTGGGAGFSADMLDGYHAASFLLLSGGTMTGPISFDGSEGDANVLNLAGGTIDGMTLDRTWASIQNDWAICKDDIVGDPGGMLTTAFDLTGEMDATLGKIILPHSSTVPATCVVGEIYWESDAEKLWIADGVNTWKEMTGGVTDHGTLTGLSDDDHTQYLLKTGGTLTGDVIIDSTAPALWFDYSTTNKAYFAYASGSDAFSLYAATGVDIYWGIGTTDVLLATASQILSYIDLAIGASDVYLHLSGGNLDLCTGSTWRMAITDTSIDYNVPADLKGNALYMNGSTTKIDEVSGDMEFTVASGKKFKFTVSA